MCALRKSTRCPSSVITLIHSEKRIVLVWDPTYRDPHWKLPGGGIDESTDETVIKAAIRECSEETGICLSELEITLHSCKSHKGRGYLHFCIAKVTEEKIDTRSAFGIEFGPKEFHVIEIEAFTIADVLANKVDLLLGHAPFIKEVLLLRCAA